MCLGSDVMRDVSFARWAESAQSVSAMIAGEIAINHLIMHVRFDYAK